MYSRFLLAALLFLSLIFRDAALLYAGEEERVQLMKKADELLTKESYPAAIAVLETILSQDPKNAEALDRLIRACDSYIQKLVSEDRMEQVQTYLDKMEAAVQKIDTIPEPKSGASSSMTQSKIKREMANAKAFMQDGALDKGTGLISLNAGREHYNEAVDHFLKHEYEIAEDLLKKSVELDPENPYAFELLGEIANLNHRLPEAEEYYRKASALNPDPSLKQKYEKVLRERVIDKSQQQYEDEHFIIRYRRNESLEGSRIRDFLREAYQNVSQEFGYYPKYKIPIVLYDWDEYTSLMAKIPHWSAAFFDGKIRLPVYVGALGGPAHGQAGGVPDEKDIRKLIQHELTHAFVLDLSKMKCPTWLNEGIAQYEENKVKAIDLSVLRDAVQTKALIGIDKFISQDVSTETEASKAQLFYLQAFSMVSYFVEHSRFYNLKQLLIELGNGASFPEAFEKVFGRTYRDMAADWQADLDRRFAKSKA